MDSIRNVLKKDKCVIALVMLYDNRTKNPTEVYRVLSCVLNYFIENYVCTDFICFQSKTISNISSNKKN